MAKKNNAETHKTITVIHNEQHHDLAIAPGTKASEILAEIGAPDVWLCNSDGLSLGLTDDVYRTVKDGAKLVTTAATVVSEHACAV